MGLVVTAVVFGVLALLVIILSAANRDRRL